MGLMFGMKYKRDEMTSEMVGKVANRPWRQSCPCISGSTSGGPRFYSPSCLYQIRDWREGLQRE